MVCNGRPIAPAATSSPARTVASILEALAVADGVDAAGLALHLARLRQLFQRGEAGLVAEISPCRGACAAMPMPARSLEMAALAISVMDWSSSTSSALAPVAPAG